MKKKESQVWEIDIPDLHPSINKWTRMHYMVRLKLKQEWEQMTFLAAKEAGLPKMEEPVEIFLTYYSPRSDVDLDNYTPKFIVDGLKQFFIDDSIQHVKKLGWEFQKGPKRSVVQVKRYQPE